MSADWPVLVEVVRGPLVESRHRGAVAVLGPDGAERLTLGPVNEPAYPRSCAKPIQLAAMLDAGLASLDLPDEALAVAAASHGGRAEHIEQVRRILAAAGLSEADLDNTPGMPLDGAARREMTRDGHGPDRLHHNCSGKHAAMLATAAVNDWPLTTYRHPDHPLQQAIRERLQRLSGDPVPADLTTVDGCGAALFAVSIAGLARAFLAVASAPEGSSEARVVAAMRRHPELVGGPGRDVTALLHDVPGLLAKDGAEGVYAVASAELGAVAVKIEDGSGRGRVPVIVAGLRELGASYDALDPLATSAVEGHGEPVGEVRAVSPLRRAATS